MLYLAHKAVHPNIAQHADAVRTNRWKYIQYNELKGMDELYDLERDPFETQNLAGEPGSDRAMAEVCRAMERLRSDIVPPAGRKPYWL